MGVVIHFLEREPLNILENVPERVIQKIMAFEPSKVSLSNDLFEFIKQTTTSAEMSSAWNELKDLPPEHSAFIFTFTLGLYRKRRSGFPAKNPTFDKKFNLKDHKQRIKGTAEKLAHLLSSDFPIMFDFYNQKPHLQGIETTLRLLALEIEEFERPDKSDLAIVPEVIKSATKFQGPEAEQRIFYLSLTHFLYKHFGNAFPEFVFQISKCLFPEGNSTFSPKTLQVNTEEIIKEIDAKNQEN
jgi:hypothetical protein